MERRIRDEERHVGSQRVDAVEKGAHLALNDLARRRGLRLGIEDCAVPARDDIVVAAVRRVRDAEPVRGGVAVLALEHLSDEPLERAATRLPWLCGSKAPTSA